MRFLNLMEAGSRCHKLALPAPRSSVSRAGSVLLQRAENSTKTFKRVLLSGEEVIKYELECEGKER